MNDEMEEIYKQHLPQYENESYFDYLLRKTEFYHNSKLFDKYKINVNEILDYLRG